VGAIPFQLDSKPPSLSLDKYVYNESRYTMLLKSNEEAAERLLKLAQQDIKDRWRWYEQLAAMTYE
jgi:pyruvate-ferredoxin/flavodoxin oxidoreductase